MERGPNYASLNLKQQRFVDALMSGRNQTQAAIEAGYSPKRADVRGSTLMRNERVLAALREVRGPEIASVDELQRFWTAAFRDDFETLGAPKPPFKPMSKSVKAVCPACEMKHEVEIRQMPEHRLKASEYLAKTRGMFLTKVEHSGGIQTEPAGRDISTWPLELAEEYVAMMEKFASKEAELVARAKVAMESKVA